MNIFGKFLLHLLLWSISAFALFLVFNPFQVFSLHKIYVRNSGDSSVTVSVIVRNDSSGSRYLSPLFYANVPAIPTLNPSGVQLGAGQEIKIRYHRDLPAVPDELVVRKQGQYYSVPIFAQNYVEIPATGLQAASPQVVELQKTAWNIRSVIVRILLPLGLIAPANLLIGIARLVFKKSQTVTPRK